MAAAVSRASFAPRTQKHNYRGRRERKTHGLAGRITTTAAAFTVGSRVEATTSGRESGTADKLGSGDRKTERRGRFPAAPFHVAKG